MENTLKCTCIKQAPVLSKHILFIPQVLASYRLDCSLRYVYCIHNTKFNDLRIIIYLRRSGVTVERISVCNGTEKFMEYGIYCLPCSYTKGVIDLLP